MAAAAANTYGPEKSIAERQHIVESPVASASVDEDMLFLHDLHLSSSPDPAADDDERSEAKVRLGAAKKVILRPGPFIHSLTRVSDGKYLSAVDEIILLSGGGVDGEVHGVATSLLTIAMFRLTKVFGNIISVNSAILDADHRSFQSLSVDADDRSFQSISVSMPSENSDPTTDDFSISMEEEQHPAEERGWYSLSDDQTSNLITSEDISDLKEIADRMIAAGYQQELCQAYCRARQDFLNGFHSVLVVDELSIEHAQRIEWKTLREKVRKWSRRLHIFVGLLLPRERELCDHIFVASDELKEESFRKTVECVVLRQLNLWDMIAERLLQSQNEIFLLLDIYEDLSDLQALFSGDSGEFICGEVEQIVERLGKMVRGCLAKFEYEIRSEKLRKPLQSGHIHPLVRYAMNYITKLVCYGSSLNLLLYDDGVDGGDDSVRGESMTPFGQRTHLFMSFIECRIQEISNFYTGDDALKSIFLMNNVLCMVLQVEDSELKALLGDDWVRTRRRQIEQYATCFLRASWCKPLSYLKDDGLSLGSGSGYSAFIVALKEKFKKFNLAFEKIWSTQAAWIVPDPQLREELRLLIVMTIIPGYRSFFRRYGICLNGGQRISKFLKYTPEDLENHLSDFFEGTSQKSNHPRRKLGS